MAEKGKGKAKMPEIPKLRPPRLTEKQQEAVKKMKANWPKTKPDFPNYYKGDDVALLDRLMHPGFDNGWNDPPHPNAPDEWYAYCKDLENALSKEKKNVENHQIKASMAEEEAKATREKAVERFNELGDENVILTSEKEELRLTLKSYQTDAERKQTVLVECQKELEECQVDLEKSRTLHQEHNNWFTNELATAKREKMESQGAFAILTGKHSDLQGKFNALQLKYDEVEKKLNDSTRELSAAANTIKTSEDNYQDLERKATGVNDDLTKAEQKIAERDSKLKEERKLAADREEYIESIEQQLKAKIEKYEALEIENAGYQAKVDAAKAAQEKAETARADYEAKVDATVEDNKGLRDNIRGYGAKVEDLNREIVTLQTNNAALKDATRKLNKARGEIRALKATIQRLHDDIDENGFNPQPTAYTTAPGSTTTTGNTMANELLFRDGLPILSTYTPGKPEYDWRSASSSSDEMSLPSDDEDEATKTPPRVSSLVLPISPILHRGLRRFPIPPGTIPVISRPDPAGPPVVTTRPDPAAPPVVTTRPDPAAPPAVVTPEPIVVQVPGPVVKVPGPVVQVPGPVRFVDRYRYIDRYDTLVFPTLLSLLVYLVFWIKAPLALLAKLTRKAGLAPGSYVPTSSMASQSPVSSVSSSSSGSGSSASPPVSPPAEAISTAASRFHEEFRARLAGIAPLPATNPNNREQFQGGLPPPNGGPDAGPIMFANTTDGTSPTSSTGSISSPTGEIRGPAMIEQILARVEVVNDQREEIAGEKPPVGPGSDNTSTAIIANPPIILQPTKKRLTWSFDTIFRTKRADLPSFWKTMFGVLLNIFFFVAIYQGYHAYYERSIWLAANDNTRTFLLDLLNHPKQYYHGINRIIFALPEGWRRNVDILMWRIMVQGFNMQVVFPMPG